MPAKKKAARRNKQDDLTHETIMEMRDAVETHNVWDFSLTLGDTIKEKYEPFIDLMFNLCPWNNLTGEVNSAKIVANGEICSVPETMIISFDAKYEVVDEGLIYVGKMVRANEERGEIRAFDLYKDRRFPVDEFMVLGRYDFNRVVKVYHFVMED
jgi:hypothetical protein